MEIWRLITTWGAQPGFNLGLDEALLESSDAPVTVRFYSWKPATLSLGYFQKFAEVPAAQDARSVVRRFTGGGAIHHDRELTFSIAAPLDHPLYSCVFTIKAKGQVPNIRTGAESEYTGITWENHDGDSRTVHHRALFDDKGRLLVLATHNTDNGDGWEREGESAYYFANFSEKIAYPLGINIIFYVMTH